MERESNRPTDDDRIRAELAAYFENGSHGTISDTLARMIASRWHGGQSSSFYSFASCGAIDKEGLAVELYQNLIETRPDDQDANEELEALGVYFVEHDDRGPVEGWHDSTKWDLS